MPGHALSALRRVYPDYPGTIRRSLKTADLAEARARRDAMEAADDEQWQRIASGDVGGDIHARAIERALSLRIEYRSVADLAASASVEELISRIRVAAASPDRLTGAAVFGAAGEAETSIDDAFDVFENVIRRADLARKSDLQRTKWRQLKRRGIENFKRVVGDIPIEKIGRDEARKFHEWWLGRIAPDDPKVRPLSASAGNKDLDTMRSLLGEYFAYVGRDVPNPFRGMRFNDRIVRTRPAFSEAWIRQRILAPGALDAMNDDARRAVLALINTGARPSEIINLEPDAIVLDADIPHVDIRETENRELKARATARRIPLVGVSLEALREAKAAGGFPRYRDRDNLSAAVNKYFRDHGLMESDRHTLYSMRHAFEARLKLANVDEELRRYLMGHAISRPKYGYSDALTWAVEAVRKVAL
ncbi:integrase [Oricola thermophila]|uniref:Integrase n=1 Tax=Oricola thermophila TaxID=2742145 RepID=A0A6N1VHB7_9HYPH|nr:integrase [Oricola thermophila]QKV20280.1 integrase [Oricola thermophila]